MHVYGMAVGLVCTARLILCLIPGRRNTLPVSAEEEEVDSRQTHVRAELTSHQYKVKSFTCSYSNCYA